MRAVFDRLHGKEDDRKSSGAKGKNVGKKSLRGLEIVHVLPDAETKDVIDLSQPFFGPQSPPMIPPAPPSTISTTNSSNKDEHLNDFISNHYNFLDSHHDSSSHYSAPCSDGSTGREITAPRPNVRFSEVSSQSTDSHTSEKRVLPIGNKATPIKSFRQTLAKSVEVETIEPRVDYNDNAVESPTSAVSSQAKPIPLPDYNRLSTELSEKPTNQNSTPIKTFDNAPNHNSGSPEPTSKPTNHLDELKSRFSTKANGGLISPTDRNHDTQPDESGKSVEKPTQVVSNKPANPVEELKLRFSRQISTETEHKEKKLLGSAIKKSPVNGLRDDTYLVPKRSSGMIKLTG